ncbi:MAG: hypothetical protein ABL961_07595 [Vicinamibacterales bacterium]
MHNTLSRQARWVIAAGILVGLAAAPSRVGAQPVNAGQNVAPIFEGWLRNPDGTFTLAFGYLNRNYAEHIMVPLGPDNRVEPDGPDRGQPAYFYPRTNRFAFTVVVPKDWGKKEVVWTLTSHGRTDQAVGWLQPEWEIDRKTELSSSGRGTTFDDDDIIAKNQLPTVKVAAAQVKTTVSQALTLTATAVDDGLPPPDPPRQQLRVAGQETPPTLQANTIDSPVNVPLGPNRPPLPPRGKLTTRWVVHRGPAKVTFEPAGWQDVRNGKTSAAARFTQPGDYVLRVTASDGMFIAVEDVRVTVTASATSGTP